AGADRGTPFTYNVSSQPHRGTARGQLEAHQKDGKVLRTFPRHPVRRLVWGWWRFIHPRCRLLHVRRLPEFSGVYRLGLAAAPFLPAAMAHLVSILRKPVAAAANLAQR